MELCLKYHKGYATMSMEYDPQLKDLLSPPVVTTHWKSKSEEKIDSVWVTVESLLPYLLVNGVGIGNLGFFELISKNQDGF